MPSAPISPKALARLTVSGAALVLVADRPSAPFAQQNRLIVQGVTLAVDQLNAGGGLARHKVRILQLPLDSMSPTALQARLRTVGGPAVVILPCDGNAQFSLAVGAAPSGTLMLAPCDADASLGRRIATYWPVGTAGNAEAAALAGYVRSTGYTNAFVVSAPELHFSTAMASYFTVAAKTQRIGVVGAGTVSLGLRADEVARLAAAIKTAHPAAHVVFSSLPPPYFNGLAGALARVGVTQPLLGTSALDTPLTLAAGTAALQNATFPTYGFLRQDPAAASFAAAYRRRYGVPVGSFPGLGFETVGVLEEAIARAHSTDPSAIQRVLLGGLARVGAALFDRSYLSHSDHNPSTSVSIEKIFGNALFPLITMTPTGVPGS